MVVGVRQIGRRRGLTRQEAYREAFDRPLEWYRRDAGASSSFGFRMLLSARGPMAYAQLLGLTDFLARKEGHRIRVGSDLICAALARELWFESADEFSTFVDDCVELGILELFNNGEIGSPEVDASADANARKIVASLAGVSARRKKARKSQKSENENDAPEQEEQTVVQRSFNVGQTVVQHNNNNNNNNKYIKDYPPIPPTRKSDEPKAAKAEPGHMAEAREVVEHLNAVTGRRFRATTGSTKLIRERLNEGYTVADCERVIDRKWAEWRGTEFERHVNSTTPFRGSHFDAYLNQPDVGGERRRDGAYGIQGGAAAFEPPPGVTRVLEVV